MGLETGTYISDLVSTNPVAADPKSQGDDHLRLIKATVKATFPNISGAVTPTHTELNYVDGVTSAIQTQIDTKGAIAGQAWTGTQDFTGATATASTQSVGDSSTNIATTAFVAATSFSTNLPGQTSNSGKFLTTDGAAASWDWVQRIPTVVVITSTTTWTCPAGITKAKVTVVGGGGSGSSGVSQAGGGGGGGGTAIKWLTVTPATVYTATIGAGGAALGSSGSGNNGGNSTFSGSGITTITANGGSGGAGSTTGGDGGAASGGDINVTGGSGTESYVNNSSPRVVGGSSMYGAGKPDAAGTGYGSGGGAIWNGAGSYAGASGVVIIEY